MTTQPNEQNPQEITVRYWRSPLFRVIHMNGVYGGLTPSGDIQATFYVDRAPYPEAEVYHPEGTSFGPVLRRTPELAPEIERELEVEVHMSYRQAVRLREWLDEKIELFDKIAEELKGTIQTDIKAE